MADSSSASSGIGLAGIVFVVFLTLKLAEVGVVATWSWWWVCAPLWIPTGIVVAFFAVVAVLRALAWVVSSVTGRNRWKSG